MGSQTFFGKMFHLFSSLSSFSLYLLSSLSSSLLFFLFHLVSSFIFDLLSFSLSSFLFSCLLPLVSSPVFHLLSSLFSSLVLSLLLPSSLAFLSSLVFSCLSFSVFFRCLSLSVPVSVCCCCVSLCVVVVVVVVVWRVWCGTLNTAVCTFQTSPCVHSKRFRVYVQNARMFYTCARFARTHGSVLNLHTVMVTLAGVVPVHTVCGEGEKGGRGVQRDTPTPTHCTPTTTHATHNEQAHNTQHTTRKVASSVLLTKICPRKVIT